MEIAEQPLEGDIMLLRLNGRLDASSSSQVRGTLRRLLDAKYLKIIIDLKEVPFIDSSGLVALVSGLRVAREQGGNIMLSGAQPQAQTVFQMTMIDRVFVIHPTSIEARQSLI